MDLYSHKVFPKSTAISSSSFKKAPHPICLIFQAINHDDISFMKDIKRLKKKDIAEFIKHYTISPLILAVMMNRVKVAEFLISQGADINVKCELPKDYLYLGENWAKIEYYTYNKWTPLQIAKNKGHTDMIKLLSNK